MEKILIVSHCILNKAAKVEQDERELAAEYEVRSKLLAEVLEQGIQLIQLPCPEFILYGSRRWGHVRDQFSHPFYRKMCRDMLEPVLMQIQEYASDPERFEILGIVSVEGSPSCGRSLTCAGNWGGELSEMEQVRRKVEQLEMKRESGVFMEEITDALREKQLNIPVLTMEEAAACLGGREERKE